jgi:hypothetical protein
MKGFNLSRWALEHRSFVWYLMLLFVVSGVWSYLRLGRDEDPPFTVKTMIVTTHGRERRSRRQSSKSPIGSRRSCKRRRRSIT